MPNKLVIVSQIPPSVNNYLRYKVERNPRGRLYVRAYKSEESVIYENTMIGFVKSEIEKQGWDMPTKDSYIIIDTVFYWPKHGMDCNNHWKLPLDVFKTAGVYNDDSKVAEGVRRIYIDADNPRIEMEIYVAPWVGIFDNAWDLSKFKHKNCFNCTKKQERCSIMKKALQNRLTNDITLDKMTCNKIKLRK